MKFIIVLFALICFTSAQTTQDSETLLRDQLVRKAEVLITRIKDEIKILENEKRGHLAQLLQEEEKRLETLTNDLKVVNISDVVKLAVLEDQLIAMEYRVENEINLLERERATQERLLLNSKTLKEWTTEEIKRLEATQGVQRQQALLVAQQLRGYEQRLDEITMNLVKAQDQITIERYEVELRAIEANLNELLRILHFSPPTVTPSPVTVSTKPPTTRPTTTKPLLSTTANPGTTTAKPAPTTNKPTTITVAQTPSAVTTRPSTSIPVTDAYKEKLIETAKQLESDAEKEIKILTDKGNIDSAYELKVEKTNLQDLIIQLEATNETDLKPLKRIEQEVILVENKLKELINKYKIHNTKNRAAK